LKSITIQNILEETNLIETEQHLIFYYLKNKQTKYSHNIILSSFLKDFTPNTNYEAFFSKYNNVLDISKEFEHLISIENKEENGAIYTPISVVDKMLSINILDKDSIVLEPSVGGGVFVFKLLTLFNDKYNTNIKETLKNNIFMNDIDIEAINRLKLLLAIFGLEQNENIENKDINITHFDFLSEEFNEFYKNFKFDLIIGNPPYLSLEKGFLKEAIELYKIEYKCIFKVYDIFGIFIEKSLRFLQRNGQLSFIVPSTLFTNDSFEKLRTLMLDFNMEYCIQLGDKVFENAVVPACIFKIVNNDQKKINLEIENEKHSLDINDIIGDKNSFRLGIDYDFNKKIIEYSNNKTNVQLSDILTIKEAIKTGKDKDFIFEDKKEGFKPLVKGKHIKPLSINQKLYLDYNREKLSRPLNKEFFERNKIFIRRVSNKIIAAFDNQHLYATHTLYCAFSENDLLSEDDYELITILLNSEFYTKMYQTLFPFKGNIFPEIRTTKLRQLIFPNIDIIRKNKQNILSCIINSEIEQKSLSKIINNML
jgi:hypothetical protein